MKKLQLGRALIAIGKEIMSDCPDMSDEECDEIFQKIMDIRSGTVWYSKIDSADYLHVSSRTFDRLVHDGFIPKGEHHRGLKELTWKKADLDKYARQNKH